MRIPERGRAAAVGRPGPPTRTGFASSPSTDAAATVVPSRAVARPAASARLDPESREWLRSLRARGAGYDDAVGRLHALLLGAARFEVARRRPALPHLRGDELPDIAMQAADDALMSVLRRLDDFRGDSRFTTWAYKFALLEAAVTLRRRSWQGRELVIDPDAWDRVAGTTLAPQETLEQRQLIEAVRGGIDEALTPHQREVLVALALEGVPIDVLAQRRDTTRGALYKTLHDARQALRRHLRARGLALGDAEATG